ncbi:MAG TPA: hypothetical protein VLL54_14265 [Pyrinomonadaceae bacterium]|nr:hypothetical protein [Pyrinomonadaceae bacterium]
MEKKKQTLYNFVSLRSPQSVTSKEKDFRFIEIPCYETESRADDLTCETLADLINKESGITGPKEAEGPLCCPPSENESDLTSFTGQAHYISENRSEIDYYHLMGLHSSGFTNIGDNLATLLFVEFVKKVNADDPKDFELKEKIGNWLVLWNLRNNLCELERRVEREKALKEAEDARHNRISFGEAGSKRKFMIDAARPHIQQLLNATIVAPKEEIAVHTTNGSVSNKETVKLEENGPVKTKVVRSLASRSASFVPSKELNKKHEIKLAAFRLNTLQLNDEDNRVLARVLANTILENTDFAKTTTFFAGSPLDIASGISTRGVKASMSENADNFNLIPSFEPPIENNIAPVSAIVRIKANSEYVFSVKTATVKAVHDIWYLELSDIGNLKNEGGCVLIELTFANGHTYSTFIPINTLLSGAGELFDGKAIPFCSSFEPKATDEYEKDEKGNPTEKRITEWWLNLTGIGLPEIGPATIQVYLKNNGDSYPVPEINQVLTKPISIYLKDFPRNPIFLDDYTVSVLIAFGTGGTYVSLPYRIKFTGDNSEACSFLIRDSGYDAYGKTYTPKSVGITQLGVADYQRVVSHVIRYEAAEVAHIENLMAREYKEKVVTKEHITEVTDFESLETETEKLNDSTSAERFQMQTEIAKMQHEDNKNSLDARLSYNSGTGTSLDINYANSTATSREESNRQATTTAKELTNRAMERIVSRIKTERTQKVTNRLMDVAKQGFDNRGSSDHVSGVYRYVNAIYKNEIESYGRRLAYEFAIPEPSKLYRLGMAANAETNNLETMKKPIDPRTIRLDPVNYPDRYLNWDQIDIANYLIIAGGYNADVTPSPEETKIGTVTASGGSPVEVTVADGYLAEGCVCSIGYSRNDVPGLTQPDYDLWLNASVEGIPVVDKDTHSSALRSASSKTVVSNTIAFAPAIPGKFSLIFNKSRYIDIGGITIVFNQAIDRNSDLFKKWQREVFKQIVDAYEKQIDQYREKVSAIKQAAKGTYEANPLNYRQIEQTILRMNCISYLMAPYGMFQNRNFGKQDLYKQYDPDPTKEFESTRVNRADDSGLDEYAAFVKFLEQAFEWNIMSYNFYPFYWAGEDSWKTLYQADYDDPIFKSFMQTGMARVVVTVRPGFEFAVLLYMITGKIWANGHVPVYDDPLYVSMANELKDPPYTIADHWETVLPTNLIALQRSGAIVNAHGLPNFEHKEDNKYDNFDSQSAQFNPIIKNDERILATKKRSWWARLAGK